jgi:hypothetical protein
MNPRNFINFFRSPVGAFSGFCVLVVIALVAAHHFQKPNQGKPLQSANSAGATKKPQLIQSVHKDMQPLRLPRHEVNSTSVSTTTTAKRQEEQRPLLSPISLFSDSPSAEPKALSKLYAPYGRLIPCELIVTVDSSTISTPIIGLITEDVYHAGNLIIPAGTEVHGLAQVDRARERIASGNRWTLVFQDGEEMTLNGVALDRDTDTNGTGWDITDGSAGLRGRLIKTDDLAEIKLFAATFLSGAAGALTANQQTLLGTQVLPTTQNAALEGAQSVLATYAKQILDSIERDGFYVRVPAGKQFYLYVTQTIDRTDAAVGESRSQPNDINNPPSQTPSRRETSPIVPMQP